MQKKYHSLFALCFLLLLSSSCSKITEFSEKLEKKQDRKKSAERIKNLEVHDQIFKKLGELVNFRAFGKVSSQAEIKLISDQSKRESREKSKLEVGKNGVKVDSETLPSEKITYLKVNDRYFQKSKSGDFFESQKLKENFVPIQQEALGLPKYYLEFFKDRIKFEKREDLEHNEVYQILLKKSENKLERNGMIRPKNLELAKMGALRDNSNLKLFKNFGEALSANGQIRIDKISGEIKFIDFMGSAIISLDNQIQQADIKFKTKIDNSIKPKSFRLPKIKKANFKREKIPKDYKKIL